MTMLEDITMYVWWIMRLLVDSKEGYRLFKDRNLVGYPRWIIVDNQKNEKVFSGIWYNQSKIIKIFRNL